MKLPIVERQAVSSVLGLAGSVRRVRGHGIWARRGMGSGVWSFDGARHRAIGIEQVVVVRPETELDQGARIRNGLALPTIVGLKFFHSLLRLLIPYASRFRVEVVFPN